MTYGRHRKWGPELSLYPTGRQLSTVFQKQFKINVCEQKVKGDPSHLGFEGDDQMEDKTERISTGYKELLEQNGNKTLDLLITENQNHHHLENFKE